MSEAFLKQRTNDCDTLNTCFRLRCVSDKFMCIIRYRHILCVVGVIVCNEHWKQGIQIELTCNSKLFPCSPNQCQHHLNYIHIPCPELSCFTVTVFQTFIFAWYMCIYCLYQQTEKVDRSHYNNSLNYLKLIRNFNLFQLCKFSKLTDSFNTYIVNNCYADTQNNLCIIW